MEIIRNLGGVQKGLLGGLVLGILVVYLCLCVSATGVLPLAPKAGRLETGALAAVSTVAATPSSVTTTAAVASPTVVIPTSTPVPTEPPATVEPTLAPTEEPTVAPSTPTAGPAQVALVLEQATEPPARLVLPTTVKSKPAVHKPQPAKAEASPAPATATPEWTWRGIEYERVPGSKTGNTSAVLAVRIVGVPDRKVFVREVTGGWSTTLVTGRKPQYGDFSDDVGGLQPSIYIIKPMDIDDQIQVQIDPGDYVLIEFALRPPANWTPEPTTLTETTPTPATPEVAPAPAATAAPTASALVADWAWQGIEYQRTQTHNVFGVLAVRVVGVPDRKVFIREMTGGWTTTLLTGKKPEYGDFSDDVGGLEAGTYTIKPMDIDNQVSVQLNAGDFVLVEFALRPTHPLTDAPATSGAQPTATVQIARATAVPASADASPTASADWTWQGIEYQRTAGATTGNSAGVLAVRVVGVPNRNVFVREISGGWNATLVTGNKPQYGDFSDEIGGLPPGTYAIKPMDIDDEIQVTLGTGDFVLVEFALRPARVLTDQTTAQ